MFLDGKYNRIIDNMPECLLNGKVIGEFICDRIIDIDCDSVAPFDNALDLYIDKQCCLKRDKFFAYTQGRCAFGFHISYLIIYDKPRELSDFRKPCIYGEESDVSCFLCDKSGYRPDMHIDCFNEVTTPPQSWCYVEESKE